MSTTTAVPVSEYLNTSYRPDCEYIDGELLERHVERRRHAQLRVARSARRQPELRRAFEQRFERSAAPEGFDP